MSVRVKDSKLYLFSFLFLFLFSFLFIFLFLDLELEVSIISHVTVTKYHKSQVTVTQLHIIQKVVKDFYYKLHSACIYTTSRFIFTN